MDSVFRRARSRVYHASEWRSEESPWSMILPRPTKDSPPQDWGLVLPGSGGPPSLRSQGSKGSSPQEWGLVLSATPGAPPSQGSKGSSPQDWGLVLSAPGGPPSHRSQDSGFSDSESEASPQLEFKPLSNSPQPGHPAHCSTPKSSRLQRPCRPARRSIEESPPGATLPAPSTLGATLPPISRLLNAGSCTEALDPVSQWLNETRGHTEPECMTTLQGKAIASRLGHACSRVAGARDAVRALQQRSHVISAEFAKLCQQMERGRLEKTPPLAQSLIGHLNEFVRGYRVHHARCAALEPESDEAHETERLAREEAALTAACTRLQASCEPPEPCRERLAADVAALGQAFTRLVDRVLGHEIRGLVCVLEQPSPGEPELRAALASVAALGLEGAHLGRLVARCGGIRALLALCLDAPASSSRVAALRTLAILCAVPEGVRQLDQDGGVEVLADVLAEARRPEAERAEAAAVVAQATAPGADGRPVGLETLPDHLDPLVAALSRLAGETSSGDTLLLALAALTNLSYLEPRRCVAALITCKAAGRVLAGVRRRAAVSSLFVHEQAATLLANMAAVAEARAQLVEARAVVSLLCFLQVRPSPLQRAAESAAAERVQQKSAIALSRLCSAPAVARQVVELQGAERLVRLCKDERERNHSDGVLVACLSALRKIATHCGSGVVERLDARELVEPRLLDSFLLYSSRQESYV